MVAYIIISDRLNATWVKCHLVAINPGGNYQGNRTLRLPLHVSLQCTLYTEHFTVHSIHITLVTLDCKLYTETVH